MYLQADAFCIQKFHESFHILLTCHSQHLCCLNICRFFPDKAASLALEIVKELVQVSTRTYVALSLITYLWCVTPRESRFM